VAAVDTAERLEHGQLGRDDARAGIHAAGAQGDGHPATLQLANGVGVAARNLPVGAE
jgi:hypothetical protein